MHQLFDSSVNIDDCTQEILLQDGQTAADLANEAGYDYITRFIDNFLRTNDASLPTMNGQADTEV